MIRRNWSLTLLCASLLVAGCGSSGSSTKQTSAPVVLPKAKPEAKSVFEEGLRLMLLGPANYTEARKQFRRAVELDKSLYEAWHNLGVLEAKRGRFEAAREALERAYKLQPGSRATALTYVDVLGRTDRWSEAQQLLAALVASDPADFDLRLRYVRALRDGGRAADALEEIKAALAKNSHSAEAFNALGLVYLKMNKHGLAESAFKRATELDPKAAMIWNNLGLVALARGQDQEAFSAFSKATDVDGRYREAYLNKAVVYLDCGDYKKAMRELESALRLSPEDPEVLVAIGVASRGAKQFDKARSYYDRALEAQPNYPPALYNLGVLFMDFEPNDKKKARENLLLFRKVAASDDPKLADAVARLKELR